MNTVPEPDSDDPEVVLRAARDRFIEAFPGRIASFTLLSDSVCHQGAYGPIDSLRRLAHQMAGLAGTIGFPTVSERARELEQLVIAVSTDGADCDKFHRAIDAVKAASETDRSGPAPDWAKSEGEPIDGPLILVAEDDHNQRAVVVATLRHSGFRVVALETGGPAVETARAQRPAAILLDVDLPKVDGYTICRTVKTSPDLSSTPVAFMTARAEIDDRLNGLALGADDYLVKPIDPRELSLRVQRLVARGVKASSGLGDEAGALTYETFAHAAGELLKRHGGSLVLVKLPRTRQDDVVQRLVADARRRDLVGRYDANAIVLFLPDRAPAAALERMRECAADLERQGHSIVSGIAGAVAPDGVTLESLLVEADDALNAARYLGKSASLKSEGKLDAKGEAAIPTVLCADDDPDVVRIVDAQMRAAGYRTIVVFDGDAAAKAAAERAPDLIVLDLMMPKRTGFDVLHDLAASAGPRPRTIVLSGRGREDDVTRAFSLGADDYVTKPFSPQELLARVARLLK